MNVCLERVDEIEREVRCVEGEIESIALRERRGLILSEAKGVDDSQFVERLQELEERLLRNASNIKEHQ